MNVSFILVYKQLELNCTTEIKYYERRVNFIQTGYSLFLNLSKNKMKNLLFLLLVLLPFWTIAQNVELRVLDSVTHEPLPYANIYFKNAGVGASTNEAGRALFKQDLLSDGDSIVVSYIGYEEQTLPYAKVGNEAIQIQLVASSKLLSEVVVEYVKPIKPIKIIKTAIKKTAENYSEQDVILNSYYRETVRENELYIQLNEAFLKSYYTGYPKNKFDRKIWEDWYDDESYAFEYESYYFFEQLFKDHNTKQDQQMVLASRHSDDMNSRGTPLTVTGDPMLLLAYDKIKYQFDFFNPSILKKYIFEHENSAIINGEICHVISFYPRQTNREYHTDQRKKNKFAIYIGRAYISKESYALVKCQYKLAVDREYGFFARRIPLDYQVELNYKKQNDRYYMDDISFSQLKRVGTKENGDAILLTVDKELHVLDVESEKVFPLPDSSLFKSTRFSAIRTYKKNYNPEYWDTVSLGDSLQLSQKIIADLEVDRPLSVQFEDNKTETKKELPQPIAGKEAFTFNYHGQKVVDSLHWMALPQNESKFKKYLAEENKFAKNELIPDKDYQRKLFDKLNTFYPKSDEDEKQEIKPNSYYVETDSLDNDIYYYQRDSTTRVEVINLTEFRFQHKNIFIKRLIPNSAKNKLIIQYDIVGYIGDFAKIFSFGNTIPLDSIAHVYDMEWYSESSVLYAKTNKIGSPRALLHRDVISKQENLIYTEGDPQYDVSVSKVGETLICTIQSRIENEVYLVNTDLEIPSLELLRKREEGVEFTVKTKEEIYLLVNDEKKGSFIEISSFSNPSVPSMKIDAIKGDYIIDILPLQNKVIAMVYDKSIPQLKYIDRTEKKWKPLKFDLGLGSSYLGTSNEEDGTFTFSFSSLNNPYTTYKYDFATEKLSVVSKTTTVKSAYYRYNRIKRVWAKNPDGTKIPITLMKNRAAAASDINEGLILRAYGAYGAISEPYFDAQDAILLDEGYIIAYAHIRGGGMLGQQWYSDGRAMQKQNSISDYLACAKYLIDKGHTTAGSIIGYGNSAGGVVIAQAANLQPVLFNTIILDHPQLDVVNTMMNDNIPLTIDEYKEVGNPQDEVVYKYMLEYSPYHNIKLQKYPNVLLIGSYQDYQTPIWQIAAYTAKLREHNLSDSKILLLTDMNSGHIGNTSGKEWIRLFAETYSFVKGNIIPED